MTVTTRLSEFIKNLTYEEIPPEVIAAAKDCILDTLGSAIGGAGSPDVLGIVGELEKYDGQKDCTLWALENRASVLNAVLINGTLAHTTEMDDVHKRSKSHAGAVVVPAALTLGEFKNISGKDLLLSVIAGYEVMLRIGIGIGATSHRLKGWHATSTCGTFGAAAVAAKILGMDIDRTVSALGIAGTQSSGLWAFTEDGATCKKFHAGKAAHGGVLAAFLASGGMTGPRAILEASDGGLFKASSDEFYFEEATKGLGRNYEILKVDRKPYACCRSMHPSINAILEMKKEYNLKPNDIQRIDVQTYEIALKQCGLINQPKNVFEAKFSIPYGVAVALFDDHAFDEQFSENRIRDNEVLELARKVFVYSNDKFTQMYPHHWGCALKVVTKDNRELQREIFNAKGDSENPLTQQELQNKFKGLTKAFLTQKNQENIIEKIYRLECLESIRVITDCLS